MGSVQRFGLRGKKGSAEDEESVGDAAESRVVMEAAPAAALEVVEPNLLLQFLVVAFDAPAQFGQTHELTNGRFGG